MSRGRGTVNKVILIGRLGADPQLRFTPSGRPNASFNLATNAVWKDQEGNQQERTDWHRIVAWGKLAEIIGEYLKKGSSIFLEGRLQTRSYEDNGQKKYITEVVADSIEMLGKKGEGSSSDQSDHVPPDDGYTGSQEPADDLPF